MATCFKQVPAWAHLSTRAWTVITVIKDERQCTQHQCSGNTINYFVIFSPIQITIISIMDWLQYAGTRLWFSFHWSSEPRTLNIWALHHPFLSWGLWQNPIADKTLTFFSSPDSAAQKLYKDEVKISVGV